MSGPIVPVSPHTAVQPAENANANAAKLKHAATEFESILVKQLLKAAKLGGGGQGDKANGYADMTVDALASAIERGGGLGLANRIEQAIGHTAGHAVQAPQAGHAPQAGQVAQAGQAGDTATTAARNVHAIHSGGGE